MNRCDLLACNSPLLIWLTGLLFSHSLSATSEDFKWHGYLSQGLVYTSDNQFFGDSENVSFELTDVAVGANWRPTPRLQLAAQALYRQAGGTSRDDVYIDYALLDFTLTQRLTWTMGARAGRIKNPYGLFNDTRDLAKNRPSILLPESIYRDPIRDIFHTSDSLSIYGHNYVGDHLIQWDLLSGNALTTDMVKNEFVRPPLSGELDNERIDIARVLVESFGGKLRFAYTYTKLDVDFDPDPGSQLVQVAPSVFVPMPLFGYPGNTRVDVDLWSLEYNSHHWQLNAEYQTLDYTVKNVYGPGSRQVSPSLGYYLSASYRFNNQWRAFLRHDVYFADKDDKDGSDYQQLTGMPDHNRYAHDTTIGARYEFNKNWLVALEYHRIRGTAWLSYNENDLSNTKERWNLFSAQISYHF